MSRHDTALLVVDVQGKLASLVQDQANMTWNIHRLIRAAQTLGLPVAGTEQYPEGLGPTIPVLAELLTNITSKRAFSCGEIGSLFADWSSQGIHKILLAGIEAHVCIQQTAFDLLSAGFQVYLAVDAISSRQQLDAQVALARLEACGATLTT
ncbi:MAG: isochorismatase family protein, partial [Planctomycetaceae bacterium]|nr:isochorismatase family protein [Planctomycetaceae bacterium]